MENNTIAGMLNEEIVKTLKDIADANAVGDDEFKRLTEKLKMLHSQRMAELEEERKNLERSDSDYAKMQELTLKKAEVEGRLKQAEAEAEHNRAELEIREAELAEARKGRWWRTALDILGITVPVGVSSYWMFKGMKFEEEGKVYTSRTGQWLMSHLRLFGKKG